LILYEFFNRVKTALAGSNSSFSGGGFTGNGKKVNIYHRKESFKKKPVLLKLLYLAISDISKRWTMKIRD